MTKLQDDYKWEDYTKEYSEQIQNDVSKHHKMILEPKDFTIKNNELIFSPNISLCGNWMEIYSQVIEKNVTSVMETGCGSCQHLQNLAIINPNLDINGCDLLGAQIAFGREFLKISEDIISKVKVMDFSDPLAPLIIGKTFSFVYEQAVLIHLNYLKATNFLRNMLAISNKYVFFIDRPGDHDFNQYFALYRKEGMKFTVEKTTKHIQSGYLLTKC